MISQSYMRHLNLAATLEGLIRDRELSLEDVVTELEEKYAAHPDCDPDAYDEDYGGPGYFESFEELPTDLLQDYVDELLEEGP